MHESPAPFDRRATAATVCNTLSLTHCPYAYAAEAAIWDYQNARAFRDECYLDSRLPCLLYGQATRSALRAWLLFIGRVGAEELLWDSALASPFSWSVSSNLLIPLRRIRATDGSAFIERLRGDESEVAARHLSLILCMLQQPPAGEDYVQRDFFDQAMVLACHDSATLLVDAMVHRLLKMSLQELELNHHEARKRPMTDAKFWIERAPAGDEWRRREWC